MNNEWRRKRLRDLPLEAQRILLSDILVNNETLLRRAIRKMPTVNALRSELTRLLRKRGRKSAALVAWRETVAAFPGIANPFFQRAYWALDERAFAEAEKYLRLCLMRDNGYFSETAHFWRAEALGRLGRYDEALGELKFVSDDFEEQWFLDYRRWSKSDLMSKIAVESATHK